MRTLASRGMLRARVHNMAQFELFPGSPRFFNSLLDLTEPARRLDDCSDGA